MVNRIRALASNPGLSGRNRGAKVAACAGNFPIPTGIHQALARIQDINQSIRDRVIRPKESVSI